MSISASKDAQINPGVVSGGGSALALNGVLLTEDTAVAIGSPMSFTDAASVGDFFGTTSPEYDLAVSYFLAFDDKTQTPGLLYLWQYPSAAVSAYLRSASLAAMTLTQLQALSGTLIVTVDGTVETSGTIDLSTATSFTDAATIIAAGFTSPNFAVSYDTQRAAFVLTSNTTGATSTITEATGTLAASLYLSTATGAILSQGADAATPSSSMDDLIKQTQDWACFMTVFEPVDADKIAFASWNNAQNKRYVYILWESSTVPAVGVDTTTAYYTINTVNGDEGVVAVYKDYLVAAMIMGTTAAINFGQHNGRITYKFKSQSGLPATVTDDTTASYLDQNGYNYMGGVATANDAFTYLRQGVISGKYDFIDEYVNEIYYNSQLQLALITLYTNTPSVPYNPAGYGLVEAAMKDPTLAMVNFGGIRAGVSLSTLQASEVNNAAGVAIDKILNTRGWYIQVLDPGSQVRAARGTPVINVWYMDGGAIHFASVASIVIQ